MLSVGGLFVPPDEKEIPPALYFAHVLVFSGTALFLLVMGRRDRRAVSLGVFFLLVASTFTGRLLNLWADADPPFAPALRFLSRVHVEAFKTYLFWMFVRDFPRTPRVQRRGWLFRGMAGVALALGAWLFAANLALALGVPAEGALDRWFGRDTSGSLFWPLLYGALVPAFFYAVRQARRASPDERRRVWTMVGGLALGAAPILAFSILPAFIPALWRFMETPEGERVAALITYPGIYAIPLVTAYAVLAHRALDLQRVLRRALQYGLARYTLGAVAAIPLLALLGFLYARRAESLAEIAS
ncbi:MAG TPA: hypothetical protein VFX98_08700, partial [Longimicrobiaceae bacterium]|nr:hypothetical protein [Longimicrobiaceae bacterium]